MAILEFRLSKKSDNNLDEKIPIPRQCDDTPLHYTCYLCTVNSRLIKPLRQHKIVASISLGYSEQGDTLQLFGYNILEISLLPQ